MTGFAPAPWKVERGQPPPHRLMIYDGRGRSVGMVFERGEVLLQNDQQAQANARLIEQAPALAEQLRLCVEKLNARGVACPDAHIILARVAGHASAR